MSQMSFNLKEHVWTVTSLSAEIHRLLSRSFEDIRVAGEISGYKVWQSGHAYFTLKDAGSQIRCVVFRNALRYIKFRPQDGLSVVARGTVEVRQERGEHQLVVSGLEPQGYGELQFAFEQLKQKLAAEGLFEADRKRPIPSLPRRIGIVTSPLGAVIRDILNVLQRRWPGVHVRLYPTPVQGEGAVEGVCEGLRYFGDSGWADLVIVARGGGSLEDLWSFNEEAVARAISASPIPIVSAIGHETDFTIADFVADLRAPTPSAAAELVVPDRTELQGRISAAGLRVARAVRFRISEGSRTLHGMGSERVQGMLLRQIGRSLQLVDEVDNRARTIVGQAMEAKTRAWRNLDGRLRERDLRLRLARAAARMGMLQARMWEAANLRMRLLGHRFHPLTARLEALSPLGVLERGYAIVESERNRLVRRSGQVKVGEELRIRLHEGRLGARVEEID